MKVGTVLIDLKEDVEVVVNSVEEFYGQTYFNVKYNENRFFLCPASQVNDFFKLKTEEKYYVKVLEEGKRRSKLLCPDGSLTTSKVKAAMYSKVSAIDLMNDINENNVGEFTATISKIN